MPPPSHSGISSPTFRTYGSVGDPGKVPEGPRSRRILFWFAKLAASIGLLWFIIDRLDVDAALSRIEQVAPEPLVLALIMVFITPLIASVRWMTVMRAIGAPLPFMTALRIFFIGLFFNAALPSIVGGDAVRIWELSRLRYSLGKAVSGVFLDRLTALAALTLIVIAGQPVYLNLLGGDPLHHAVVLVPLILVASFAAIFIFDRLPSAFLRLRPVRALANIVFDARTLFLSLRHILPVLGLSRTRFPWTQNWLNRSVQGGPEHDR